MSFLPNPNAIKQGDTKPLVATLYDANGPADIAGATLEFRMKSRVAGSGHAPIAAPADNLQDVDGDGNPVNVGMFKYAWDSGETDVPGTYGIEVAATYLDDSTQTFPNSGTTTFEIEPSAA